MYREYIVEKILEIYYQMGIKDATICSNRFLTLTEILVDTAAIKGPIRLRDIMANIRRFSRQKNLTQEHILEMLSDASRDILTNGNQSIIFYIFQCNPGSREFDDLTNPIWFIKMLAIYLHKQ